MSEQESIVERIRFYREKLQNAPGTWPAKRELADAVRELMDCLCATDAPSEELLAIAAQVRASAHRFTGQPHMTNPPGVAEGSLAAGMEMFMDRSPIVGLANPLAPPVKLDPDHETKVVHGEVTFGRAYEGAPGCAHGGYVAAVFDEALGLACVFSGSPGMTGEITIRYRKPTPIRVPLRIEARMDRREGRKIYNSGTLHAGDMLVAESRGLFISVEHEKFAELRAAQDEREKDRGETS
ncbi:MAG: PaaI family thioesterase [Deltaproteobacteria bacterium]|nr:PaaI family thioesterase [Deltaproteobacteria bacterium]MBW2695595.1 PaaI family thioesterase [Deltaproteobacteria bacterium]